MRNWRRVLVLWAMTIGVFDSGSDFFSLDTPGRQNIATAWNKLTETNPGRWSSATLPSRDHATQTGFDAEGYFSATEVGASSLLPQESSAIEMVVTSIP